MRWRVVCRLFLFVNVDNFDIFDDLDIFVITNSDTDLNLYASFILDLIQSYGKD
nr:MAG TPA: hypothetical protein [Caudoviricetes sp.]